MTTTSNNNNNKLFEAELIRVLKGMHQELKNISYELHQLRESYDDERLPT